MNRITLGAGALLLLSTSVATAGALDRTGQPIGIIFEDGDYAELSYGFTRPEVRGTFPATGAESGDIALDFSLAAFSIKYDLTDRLSVALIVDEPFGADVDYTRADAGYPIGGSTAEFESSGITVLSRYEINDSFSVHGGLRAVEIDADLFVQLFNPDGSRVAFDGDFESDKDLGFVVGGAYEREDIALRVALTYSSETSFEHDTSYSALIQPPGGPGIPFAGDGVTSYTLPQSVNLDFQTGIAAGTLLFGSVRWADWSETEIRVPFYSDDPMAGPGLGLGPVVSYEDDYFTYTLGVGRQFTDRLAASATVIYEPGIASDFDPANPEGTGASNLSPPDGQLGIQLGASYAVTDSLEVSGGIRYTRLGDATTRLIGAEFDDSDAVSLGLRAGYRF